MKEQILKSMAMTTLVVALACVAAAIPAKAQTVGLLKAKVPFEFVIGDQVMPAGDYTISSPTQSGDVLRIQNSSTSKSVGRLTIRLTPKTNDSRARLIFRRYGEVYFLKQVWNGSEYSGRQLLESKKERAIRREMGTLASARYEVVELAAVGR